MEKKTKIILGVVAVIGIAYFTRDKWMPIYGSSSKTSSADGGCGCGCSEEKSNYLDTGGGGGISGAKKGKSN